MSLICQPMPDISGVSKLQWTSGHPVCYLDFIEIIFLSLQARAATPRGQPLARVRAELQPGRERRARLHADLQLRGVVLRSLHHPQGQFEI